MMTEQKKPEIVAIYPFNSVLSFEGEPPDVYGGFALSGQKRKESMMAFLRGEDTGRWTYYRVDDYESAVKKLDDPGWIIWPWEYRDEVRREREGKEGGAA